MTVTPGRPIPLSQENWPNGTRSRLRRNPLGGEGLPDRDTKVLPMYEFTSRLATLEPPPPEMQQLFGAIHGNQKAMDGFAKVNAGTVSPAEFFSPENIGAIMAAV